jgi:hypothetical protein
LAICPNSAKNCCAFITRPRRRSDAPAQRPVRS